MPFPDRGRIGDEDSNILLWPEWHVKFRYIQVFGDLLPSSKQIWSGQRLDWLNKMCLGSEISGRVLITSVLFSWMPMWSVISKYTQCFHTFFNTLPVLSVSYTKSNSLQRSPSSYDTQSPLCLSSSLITSPLLSLSSICDSLIPGFWMSQPCFCLRSCLLVLWYGLCFCLTPLRLIFLLL